jgi:DNA adenine methylase
MTRHVATPPSEESGNRLSPFRWAGSKRKVLSSLAHFWAPHFLRYVEPFAGSASLYFRLRPTQALLGDINNDLIVAYRVIQDNPYALASALARFNPSQETYYHLRDHSGVSTAIERAARFIFLNRYCFNGLYRTNNEGKFNVPWGGKKTGKLPSLELLRAYSHQLQGARFIAGDFETTLTSVRPGDFVYLDPPYTLTRQRTFDYSKQQIDFGALWRLKECLNALQQLKIPFVVSYADSEEGRFLAAGLKTARLTVQRHIAGFSSMRRRNRELLIFPPYLPR